MTSEPAKSLWCTGGALGEVSGREWASWSRAGLALLVTAPGSQPGAPARLLKPTMLTG